MKTFNIMGVHQFVGVGGHKKAIYRGNWLKRGLRQFVGTCQKRGRRIFLRGGRFDTPMNTMT